MQCRWKGKGQRVSERPAYTDVITPARPFYINGKPCHQKRHSFDHVINHRNSATAAAAAAVCHQLRRGIAHTYVWPTVDG